MSPEFLLLCLISSVSPAATDEYAGDTFVVPPFPYDPAEYGNSTVLNSRGIPDNRQWACANSHNLAKRFVSDSDMQDLVPRRSRRSSEVPDSWIGAAEGIMSGVFTSVSMAYTTDSSRVGWRGWKLNYAETESNAAQSGSCMLDMFTIDIDQRTYYMKMSAGSHCGGLTHENVDSIVCQLARNLKNNVKGLSGAKCYRLGDSGTGFDILFAVGTTDAVIQDLNCNRVKMGNCDWSPDDKVQNAECRSLYTVFDRDSVEPDQT